MKIQNTRTGPMTIAGVHMIGPGETREFSDAVWDTLKDRPRVVEWLERGDLKAVTGAAAAPAVDPLDHDGDGKRGGSKKPKA
jgi:hypothetical protein